MDLSATAAQPDNGAAHPVTGDIFQDVIPAIDHDMSDHQPQAMPQSMQQPNASQQGADQHPTPHTSQPLVKMVGYNPECHHPSQRKSV
jgi:hypothetical protein